MCGGRRHRKSNEWDEVDIPEQPNPASVIAPAVPPIAMPMLQAEASVNSVQLEESVDAGTNFQGLTDVELLERAIPPIESDDAEVLELILSEGLDPDSRHRGRRSDNGDANNTLLHWAAHFDAPECAQVLIASGAELEAINSVGRTPLHTSACAGAADTAKVLLDNDADIEALDNIARAPLSIACHCGSLSVTKILLDYGAEVDARSAGWTALHVACSLGFDKIAEVLLEQGADIEAATYQEGTPLHLAANGGHLKVVQVISLMSVCCSATGKTTGSVEQ